MISDYKKIFAYSLAYSFTIKMYKLTDSFPYDEKNLKSQIRRTAISVPVNLAEGASKKTLNQFHYHCNVSYASARELQVLLKLAKDLELISIFNYDDLSEELDNVCTKIFYYLMHLESLKKRNVKPDVAFEKSKLIRGVIDSKNIDPIIT